MTLNQYFAVALLAFQSYSYSFAQEKIVVVDVNNPTADINKNMWGVFFEDINMGADGGLYAELVKNRSFEFFRPMMGWQNVGPVKEANYLILNRQHNNDANPRYLQVSKSEATPIGLRNEGFRGMGVKEGLTYDFSVLYRQAKAGITVKVELLDSAGVIIGGTTLLPTHADGKWHSGSPRCRRRRRWRTVHRRLRPLYPPAAAEHRDSGLPGRG